MGTDRVKVGRMTLGQLLGTSRKSSSGVGLDSEVMGKSDFLSDN